MNQPHYRVAGIAAGFAVALVTALAGCAAPGGGTTGGVAAGSLDCSGVAFQLGIGEDLVAQGVSVVPDDSGSYCEVRLEQSRPEDWYVGLGFELRDSIYGNTDAYAVSDDRQCTLGVGLPRADGTTHLSIVCGADYLQQVAPAEGAAEENSGATGQWPEGVVEIPDYVATPREPLNDGETLFHLVNSGATADPFDTIKAWASRATTPDGEPDDLGDRLIVAGTVPGYHYIVDVSRTATGAEGNISFIAQ